MELINLFSSFFQDDLIPWERNEKSSSDFMAAKKSNPSVLPLAEQQGKHHHSHDDSDISVYNRNNSSMNTPISATFASFTSSSNDSVHHSESSDEAGVKRLHKSARSIVLSDTINYTTEKYEYKTEEKSTNASGQASSSLYYQPEGSKQMNSKLSSFFSRLPSKIDESSVTSAMKSFFSRMSKWTVLLVIWVLVFILLKTNPLISSMFIQSGTKPVQGLVDQVIYSESPIIVPNVANLWGDKASSKIPVKQSTPGDDIPKKAPGDYGKDLTGEKVPHAALGNAKKPSDDSNSDILGDTLTTTAAAVKKSSVGATIFKSHDAPPKLIIVLALNPEAYKVEYLEKVLENRQRYAKLHGYGLYARYVTDFRDEWETAHTSDLNGKKSWTWAKLSIMRAAMHAFPQSSHFWYLDHSAIITNMDIDVVEQVIAPSSLGSIMLRDVPVVYDSQDIRTYKHTDPNVVRFIITQDSMGLSTKSFIFCNLDTSSKGDVFTKSLLDYWNDPLSRSYQGYNYAETSAINHIMQWHPAFLSRTAVIPARKIAGYSKLPVGNIDNNMAHDPTDLVAIVPTCEEGSSLACMKDLLSLISPSKM